MKRKIAAMIMMALLGCSAAACGPIGNKPSIDEGLHIAADDAQQRIDRLEDEDNSTLGDTSPAPSHGSDNGENTNPDSNLPTDNSWHGTDPFDDSNPSDGNEPDDPWLDFAEDGPYVEPSEPSLPIGGDVLDRDDFWLDDNTYDLIGYAESIGCTIGYRLESDPSQPIEINYCDLKFYSNRENDDRYLSIYSTCNKADEIISTYSTGWQVVGGNAYYSANGYLDGSIVIPDPSNIAMVYIQNRSYWMPRHHLEDTIDILTRLAADDPECWYRGLGINHGGHSMHDD